MPPEPIAAIEIRWHPLKLPYLQHHRLQSLQPIRFSVNVHAYVYYMTYGKYHTLG